MRTASVALLFSSSVVAPVLARGSHAVTLNGRQAGSSAENDGVTREQTGVADMERVTLGVMDTSN